MTPDQPASAGPISKLSPAAYCLSQHQPAKDGRMVVAMGITCMCNQNVSDLAELYEHQIEEINEYMLNILAEGPPKSPEEIDAALRKIAEDINREIQDKKESE